MKKFFKFLFGAVTLAAIAGGAYYAFKKFVCRDSSEDFDEFEDFEDDFEENGENKEDASENRDYIDIPVSDEGEEEEAAAADSAEE